MGLRGRVPGCGHTARRSGDEPGEARRDDGEDILDREHRGQGDPNAIGRFGDLRARFESVRALRSPLHIPPLSYFCRGRTHELCCKFASVHTELILSSHLY